MIRPVPEPSNHAERAAAQRERMADLANMNRSGGLITARSDAPAVHPVQAMVDAFPTGGAVEFADEVEVGDEDEAPEERSFRIPPMREYPGEFVKPVSPLDLARQHIERTANMVAGLRAYKAQVLLDIAAKETELKGIDATLLMLGERQETKEAKADGQ